MVSREEFTLLLSGISTCRRIPGIPVHMGYESLYHCESEEDARQVKEHLERFSALSLAGCSGLSPCSSGKKVWKTEERLGGRVRDTW